MQVIYLDVLFMVNLVMDYLVLAAAARLSGIYCTRTRLLCGAAFGAVYAAASCLPGLLFLSMLTIKGLVGICMVRIAFGPRSAPDLARLTLLFYLVSFAFAGSAFALGQMSDASFFAGGGYYIHVPMQIVAAAAAACWVVTGFIFRGGAKTGENKPRVAAVQIKFGEKQADFQLLIDSGNDLSEPVSGKPALVLNRQAAVQILPVEAAVPLASLRADNAPAILEALPGFCRAKFHLLPYRALGQENGLLLAFRPDQVLREGKPWQCVAAITPERIASGQYDGLIGL